MIIIIRGAMGVGKTSVAKKVAEKLGFEYVSIDKLLEENGLDKVEGKSIPLENFLKVNSMIPRDKDVVVDGNFYFKEVIEDLGADLVFTLHASFEECVRRDKGREVTLYDEGAKAYYDFCNRFEFGIKIDTDDKAESKVVEEIVAIIVSKR
ncbi:AAA family ATPase [Candidatus Woesearchaeota archaeon]|nr:AAA family ATPase [Candidatus Woesearchaeota archaeon]